MISVKPFFKNSFSNILSIVRSLIFLKIIISLSDELILASYFKIKIFSSIVYSFLSFRMPDLLFILFGNKSYSYSKLKKIHHSFSLFIVIILIILLLVSYFINESLFFYCSAFFIFVSIEIIESYINMNRFFLHYNKILFIRIINLFLLISIFFIYINPNFEFLTLKNIFLFEIFFSYFLILIYVFYNISLRKNFFNSFNKLKKNIVLVKNTYSNQIGKVAYDMFPNYLLSFYVNDLSYINYNISRKFYSLISTAGNTLVQVFNPLSIKLKNNFSKYLTIYLSVYCFFYGLGFIIFNVFSNEIISLVYDSKYISSDIIFYINLFIFLSLFYYIFYPIRQRVIINNLIKYYTDAIKFNIPVIIILTIILVPKFDIISVILINCIFQISFLITTYIYLIISKKSLLK